MSMRRSRPCAACLAVAFVALLLASCGGGRSSAKPPSTPEAPTPTPRAAATPTETVLPLEEAEAQPSATEPPRCPDPYPDGAPYEPTPGAPIRLRPTGSAPLLARYQPVPFVIDPDLERIVRETIKPDEGRFAIVVKNLVDGRGVMLDPKRQFYAASLYKTWVMLEAFRQRDAGLLDFSERYVVSDYYERLALNPDEFAACGDVSVQQAIERMMRVSDNVAANLVLDRVGPSNTNDALRSLGLSVSSFSQDDSLPTTAGDMALLMEAIARGQALSAGPSLEMFLLLESESIDDRIPALLPAGTQVAHKTGNWDDATHDAGIVVSPGATYVIVVLTDFGYQDDGGGRIARLSRAVYDYYNPQ